VHGWWAASYLVLWALVIVLTVVMVSLARQLGALSASTTTVSTHVDDDGPTLDRAPQARDVTDVHGAPLTVGGPGRKQLLLFVSPGCGACEQVIPALPAIARNGQLTPLLVTDVDNREAELAFGKAPRQARLVSAPGLLADLNIPGTPYAVVTDRLGVVRAKGALTSLEQLEALIEMADTRARISGPSTPRRGPAEETTPRG
jgi:methylamine dehydrogenase accessory protein MauD